MYCSQNTFALRDLIDRPIGKDEIKEILRDLKVWNWKTKTSGLNEIAPELLKYGAEAMILWLERALGICFQESVASQDFRDMFMVPVSKGKGDK